jgi:hypothetical protein
MVKLLKLTKKEKLLKMKVSIRLNLTKSTNKLLLRYNTFEKVSYDKYFMASLIQNAQEEDKVLSIINELTGKGSLNSHFKKLYQEMRILSKEEIMEILKNSLYPIQKIEEYTYTYIPILDISIFNQKTIVGNIANDVNFPRMLVDENGTYISHTFTENEPIGKMDTYEVILSDETIMVKIRNEFFEISIHDFQSIIIKDDIDLSSYHGNIYQSIEGDHWIQLGKSTYNNIITCKDYYYDNGDHMAIYNDNVKRSSIAYSWGIFWIREKIHRYQDSSNRQICEDVANTLMNSGKINEFKTSTIIDILKNISRDKQQEIVNYILKRKESKDLAKVGLILISKGYEKGWSEDAFLSFYKFKENTSHLISLYKINPTYDFSINDLIEISKSNKIVLIDDHNKIVKRYYSDCDLIKNRIKTLIGDIVLSGTREKEKSLVIDEASKKFRKSANELIGHYKNDINKMDLNSLKQFEKRVEKFVDEHKVVYDRLQSQ